MTKVSVVIPTFNRPDYLNRLLKSIGQQTYRNFEVIVVDDASDDQTSNEQVIAHYQSSFPLRYLVNPKRSGAPFSRNRGIALSNSELIALVDDDDEWLPLKLEKQVQCFLEGPDNLGLVYTWTDVINNEGKKVGENYSLVEGNAKREILQECFIPSPSVMVTKKSIIKAGLFDERFPSCQDWDTWTRIIFSGYTVRPVKEVLTLYYKHDGATIGTSPRAKSGYVMYYLKHIGKLIAYGKIRHIIRLIRLKYAI